MVHAWLSRWADGEPTLYVHDPAALHVDTTAAAVLDTIGKLGERFQMKPPT